MYFMQLCLISLIVFLVSKWDSTRLKLCYSYSSEADSVALKEFPLKILINCSDECISFPFQYDLQIFTIVFFMILWSYTDSTCFYWHSISNSPKGPLFCIPIHQLDNELVIALLN